MKVLKLNTLILIIIFCTGLCSLNLVAQEVSVSAKLDTTEFLIGDQVGLELTVKQPVKEFVGIPVFDQEMNKQIEILEQSENDTSLLESGHYLIKKRLLVTVFDSGYYALPPIPFLYYSDTLKTEPILFKVHTMPVDTSQAIKDIKLPYEAPVSLAEAMPWIGGGLGTLLVVLIIIYIIRKLKRNEPIIGRLRPPQPAHVIALRELDKLKENKLWQKDKIKDYYTVLTDILRIYLFNRYKIHTLEKTSDEILTSLKMSDFKDDMSYNTLKEIFFTSDLVKFAKFKPLADEHIKCMEGAYDFVNKTKLIEEEISTDEEAIKSSGKESLPDIKISENQMN